MYVWVMRNKGSEWQALGRCLERGPLPFVPLVEAVREPFIPSRGRLPEDPATVMAKLNSRIKILAHAARVWIDHGNLVGTFSTHDVLEMLRIVYRLDGRAATRATPVVRASSPPALMEALVRVARTQRAGLCIRVDGVTHLESKAAIVSDLVLQAGVDASEIDLVVDAQDLPRVVSHDELRDRFPLFENARTFAIVAGTFPPSITDLSPDQYVHKLERGEWSAWQQEMQQETAWRRPAYGDYATQPAVYAPSPSFPGSPSVRYTTADQFVVLRGRAGPSGVGTDYGQFIGHARFLRQQPYYRDVLDTPTDAYVEWIASGAHKTGNLTTWRVASLERHLMVVARQVAEYVPVLAPVRRNSR